MNIRDGSEDIFRTKRQAKGDLICEDLSKSCCYKDDLITANENEVLGELPLDESIFIDGILSDIDNESPSEYEDYYGNEDVPCSTLARDGYRYSSESSATLLRIKKLSNFNSWSKTDLKI